MREPVKLLLMFVNETDTWNDRPLYQAVVQRLHQLNVAGATAQTGIVGFGHHRRVHRKGLLGIPDDRAVTIMAVDSEQNIRSALPLIRTMVDEGLMLLLDAELVIDRGSGG
jgi:PII-like signaling protein